VPILFDAAAFSSLIECLPDGLLLVDHQGTINFANVPAEALFGYGHGELLGQQLEVLLPERFRAAHMASRTEYFGEPRTRHMGSELKLVGRKKDGREFMADVSLSTLDGGENALVIAVVRDVSDRVEADALKDRNAELEERLNVRAAELERFFTVSIDMLCIANSDGYFKRLSPAFSQSLGWTVEEMLTRPFMDFVHPDDVEATLAEVDRQVVAGERVLQFENRYRHKDGSWRVLSWKSVPEEGGYMYAVARDVTEEQEIQVQLRKAKAEADSANLAKSEFLSRMSHELRTPLNSVLGYAQLLDLRYDDPFVKEATRSILKAGKHLLQMIEEVLDLSRIESGTVAVSLEPVNLVEVLHHTAGLLQPMADGSGLKLSIEDRGCEEMHVKADRQRLAQVLINILSNAIKYNRPGGQVLVRCVDHSDSRCRIEISDTGKGIEPRDREHLFKAFQRFGDQNVEGTGLGLVLSQRFVNLMGGTLDLSHSSPEGSTFYIELERAEPAFKQIMPEFGAASAPAPWARRSGTVLYIEDNLSNMRLLETLFADWKDLTLIPAIQGLVGLEMAREHHPDLILLDLNLPDIPGEKVLERLKSDPGTKSIPVVVLSADATSRQIKALREGGAAEYLTKPLDLHRLFAVLEEFLPAES